MKLENLTATISFNDLCNITDNNLSNAQKVELARRNAYLGKLIDMGYIEELLVMAAKTRLKAIKKDRALYNRNRNYFKALRIISKVKTAE